jgi:hypothetical protein
MRVVLEVKMDPNAYDEHCPTLQCPDVDDSETTHVVNTTETSGSSSAPRRSTTLLLGEFNKVSSVPVMTGRNNNVETDPALQGISEIDAATLRKTEIRDQILENSTVMAKDLEMMRKACWRGMGQTSAPAPSSTVDRRNNLNPTACNHQWREWVISVTKNYFNQNDPPSVEHINNDWSMACDVLVAAQGIIGPLAGWDMYPEQINWLRNVDTHRVSPNAIAKVDDLDICVRLHPQYAWSWEKRKETGY